MASVTTRDGNSEEAPLAALAKPAARVESNASDPYLQKRRLRRNVALAVIASAFIPYQIWTYTAWLKAGIHSHTPDAGQVRPWIIPVSEVGLVIITVAAVAWIGYDAMRKRSWTFDLMLLIGLLLTLFFDTNINFIYPQFIYSSHWVNINQWWGNAPFGLNPVGSDMVLPVFFVVGGYIGLAYWCSVLASRYFAKFKQHRPQTSLLTMSVVLFLGLSAMAIPAVIVLDHLHVWATPTGVPYFDFGSDTVRLSGLEALWGPTWVTFLGVLRYTTFTAKGFDGLAIGRRKRIAIATLATAGALNLSLLFTTGPWWFLGLYAKPFPQNYPQHLIGRVCDLPGHPSTSDYGPCPGSDQFRLPIK